MAAKKTVLLVDDEKDLTEVFGEYLSEQFEVIEFNSPKDFIEYLSFQKEVQFDIVVSDFKMPGMNGLEMVKKAYEMGYLFPFILFSGHMDVSTTIKAVDLGTYRLIEKSCGPETVLQAIKEVLLESEYHKIRRDIRTSIDQIREFYSSTRLIMEQYVPKEKMEKLFVEIDKEKGAHGVPYGEMVKNLEAHLDQLMSREESLQNWLDRKKAS